MKYRPLWGKARELMDIRKGKDRIGYKTQKPEALLKKIIECATNKNDIVLDCFGGGGTTATVASKLGRKFITEDVPPVATRVISKRLNTLHPPVFRPECPQDKRRMVVDERH